MLTGLAAGAGRECSGQAEGALYLPAPDGTHAALAGGFLNGTDFGPPAWAPDGRWIALAVRVPWVRPQATRQERDELWLVEAATGRRYRLLGEQWRARSPAWSPDGRSLAFVGADGSRAPRMQPPPSQLHILELPDLAEP